MRTATHPKYSEPPMGMEMFAAKELLNNIPLPISTNPSPQPISGIA
jgi:hypothetical protein